MVSFTGSHDQRAVSVPIQNGFRSGMRNGNSILRALNALVEIAFGVEQSVIKHEAACNDSMLLTMVTAMEQENLVKHSMSSTMLSTRFVQANPREHDQRVKEERVK